MTQDKLSPKYSGRFTLQFIAPLPKDGWLFLQQSFGFGLLYGGQGAFMSITFTSLGNDFLHRSRETLKSDTAMFSGVLLSFLYSFVMIDTYGVQNPVLKYTGMLTWFIIQNVGWSFVKRHLVIPKWF